MKYDVLIPGGYFADLVFIGLDELPAPGLHNAATNIHILPGGAYNAVVAAHRLKLNVGWISDFGSDPFSRFAYHQAQLEQLSEELFRHWNFPLRNITLAFSFPHERAFVTAQSRFDTSLRAMWTILLTGTRSIYIPGFFTFPGMSLLIDYFHHKGVSILMDGNGIGSPQIHRKGICQVLSKLDGFLLNRREALLLTGAATLDKSIRILQKITKTCVIKDGGNGAYAINREAILHVPSIAVNPLDTTGAGDCFSAGFLYGYLQKLPFIECVRIGNIVGGLSTQGSGASSILTTPKDVLYWLEHYPS